MKFDDPLDLIPVFTGIALLMFVGTLPLMVLVDAFDGPSPCRESTRMLTQLDPSALCAYGAELEVTDDPRVVRCVCPVVTP